MAKNEVLNGIYQGTGRGFGFLIPDGGQSRNDDCFIPPRREGGAWDGDRVEGVLEEADPAQPGRRVARIVRVVERGNPTVTGTIRKADRQVWLWPDNERLPGPIKLPGRVSVRDGEKAAVRISSYGSEGLPPLGKLCADFGPAGRRESSAEAILFDQHIEREFPTEVLEEAGAIPQEVDRTALKGRRDLRGEMIITIDGAASKDLDDAVSLKREGENWVLGVHIADVSAYVTPGSALDGEAFTRGTSVYFADQVIPMLPVALSNGICSLNPGVDRLTLSCFMTLDKTGAVVDHTVCESVIRSTERMTYAECTILRGPEEHHLASHGAADGGASLPNDRAGSPGTAQALRQELEGRYAHILPMLRDMAALSKKLEKVRRDRGAIDLESRESAVVCDSMGAPVAVVPHGQGESEKIIESFMLIANETVARYLCEQKWPGVFRVHEKPSMEKAETLRAMLSPLGLTLRDTSGHAFQKVLDAVKGKPQAPAVSMMVLRSMMKARYAPEDLGHFGIGAEHYCHFTSPIRRYPDLMVHRCLHALLEGQKARGLAAACDRAAGQSSRREAAAQTAERDIEKLYFAEYMQGHLGETFPVTVSGVTRFGLFVALPTGIEGLIPVETLSGDRYDCDENSVTLTGERTGEKFTLGMPLEAVCVSADPGTGRIEFRLPGQEEVPAQPRGREKPLPGKSRGKKDKKPGRKGTRPAMHVPKGRKGRKRR